MLDIKLNLGCGKNTLDNWDNLDYKKHKDIIFTDLRKKLRYKKNSVSYIFTEHFIEHLDEVDGFALFSECFRVLKKGGVLRVSTPDIQIPLDFYVWYKENGRLNEEGMSLDEGGYTSRPRKYRNPCQMINWWTFGNGQTRDGEPHKFMGPLNGNHFSRHGHKYYYDFEDIEYKLKKAGFSEVKRVLHRDSEHVALRNLEFRRDFSELIVEATK